MEQIGDKSDEELRQARQRLVDETRQLNDQIYYAELSPPEAERQQLELQRGLAYQKLTDIDAELKRRGR